MKKKIGIILLSILLVGSISTAFAAGPVNVSKIFNVFINGKLSSHKAMVIDGQLYIPADLLYHTDAFTYVNETMHRMDVYYDYYDSDSSSDDADDNDESDDRDRGRTSNDQPEEIPYDYRYHHFNTENYHAGMLKADLTYILKILDNLESISKDFRTVIYAQLHSISNGKNIDAVESKFNKIKHDYDQLSDRFEEMIDEIDDLDDFVGNDNDIEDLEDDFEDDMEDIFDDKEDALEYLKDWLNQKDDDDLDDYEDHDEDANDLIDDVRDYVEGSLEEIEDEADDLIEDIID